MRSATRNQVIAIAVVLGLATAFLVYFHLKSQEGGTAKAVVAKVDIAANTVIKSYMVGMKAMREKEMPRDSIGNDQLAIGQMAACQIAEGKAIGQGELIPAARQPVSVRIPLGMRALAIGLDPLIGIAGFLKPGDRVDVIGTFSVNNGTVTKTVVQNVLVMATGAETNAGGEKPKEQPNATICVYPDQANRIILAESKGKLRLTLRSKTDTFMASAKGVSSRALLGEVPPDVPEKAASVAATSVAPSRPPLIATEVPTAPISVKGPVPIVKPIEVAPKTAVVQTIRGTTTTYDEVPK